MADTEMIPTFDSYTLQVLSEEVSRQKNFPSKEIPPLSPGGDVMSSVPYTCPA